MDGFNNELENLDEVTLRRIRMKVFALEKHNRATQEYSESQMVEKIRKIIDECVKEIKR